MSIKLSITTAVYNLDESFLRAHIEGVEKQLTDETELILIDDCSTNNSGEICREYASENSHIRYINMGENCGLSRVRNRAIEEAKGKWIFFADGDDLLSDYFVETASKFYETNHDIIIHERLKFTQNKGYEIHCDVDELTLLPKGAGRTLSVSCLCLDHKMGKQFGLPSRAFFHGAWGALYRRDFLLKYDLKFPDGQKKAQDSVFNTLAYYYAEDIAYLPFVMYFYRHNMQGITCRYSADLPEVSASLIRHHRNCIEKLYPNDEKVEGKYMHYRLISTVMDNMRLDFFHKDNPKSRKIRKKEFLKFVESEPYKTAIEDFKPEKNGRYEWNSTITLIRKKNFDLLNILLRNDTLFQHLCGLDKRMARCLKRID